MTHLSPSRIPPSEHARVATKPKRVPVSSVYAEPGPYCARYGRGTSLLVGCVSSRSDGPATVDSNASERRLEVPRSR